VGCMAHARRKFFDLHVSNKSEIALQALTTIGQFYEVERQVKHLKPDERGRIRKDKSKPMVDALHQWMLLQRQRVTDGSATAKALDYSLKRWAPGFDSYSVQSPPAPNEINDLTCSRLNFVMARFVTYLLL
jgi:transposase